MLYDFVVRVPGIKAAFAVEALGAVLALWPAGHVAAAEWAPSDKIVLVTHASAGTSIDVFLRTVQDIWTKHKFMSYPVALENMTGASGDKARRYVAVQNRGNPHLLFGFTPQMMIVPIRMKSDITVGSFTPVALMVVEPTVMFVNADTPLKSVTDLIEAARQKPRGILQGGGAFGGPPSLMGRMMADEAKVQIAYTPFKTSGESVIALLGRHVHFIMEQLSEADQHVKAGKLRVLATSVALQKYPGLPTFQSLGMKFRTLKQFRGIMAPPGIAPEAANYHIRMLDRTRATPEWKQYVSQYEVIEEWVVGKEFATFLRDEEEVYRRLMTELGLLNK